MQPGDLPHLWKPQRKNSLQDWTPISGNTRGKLKLKCILQALYMLKKIFDEGNPIIAFKHGLIRSRK
ncbi:MAG: hypothetical protein JWO32_2825 [Bacteroidetes bacterium]|nr:hypothetical protein [Bacteroidota bacterium]